VRQRRPWRWRTPACSSSVVGVGVEVEDASLRQQRPWRTPAAAEAASVEDSCGGSGGCVRDVIPQSRAQFEG
jgi:hypothetical protein